MNITDVAKPRVPVAIDTDFVQYLLIRKTTPLLSISLFSLLDRIIIAEPRDILRFHIARSDLVIIDDTDFTIEEIERLTHYLQQFESKLVVITSQSITTKSCWIDLSDGILVDVRETLDIFTCRLMDTIEQMGFVCLDFADVSSMFAKMTKTEFYEGNAIGESRVVQAMTNAFGSQRFQATTALLIIFGGTDLTLDEFELAMKYLEKRLPDNCCLSGAVKMRPECLNTSSLRVSIFLNYDYRNDQYV
ncbi:hypothetical protein AB4304_00515 [Vibrio breoganii]|uniref:hypothetical protein n=1 Tax=Vibrio breoganii TaxID=553239 RepID=UPI000C81B389|nr:hypothetical protein [Vibrio breoganii]PMK42844.1 hypothetical protein BCU00_11625 [Vibrio breoganii]